MEIVIVGTTALVLGGGGALLARCLRALGRRRGLRLAAEAGGLSQIEVDRRSLLSPAVVGRSGVLFVRLREQGGNRQPRSVRITVTSRGSDLDSFTLRAESLRTSVEKRLGAPEIEIGDEAFDGAFFVLGPEPMVRARLHEPARRLLLHLRGQAEVAVLGGELRATIPAPIKIGLDDPLSRLLPSVVELGHHLADPLDVPRRLAENTRRDPSDAVRLQSLEALLCVTSAANVGRHEALLAAREDSDPRVRLRAAFECGADGTDALLRLVDARQLPDDACARAIAHLGRQLSFERAESLLEHALSDGRNEVAVAALRAVAEHGTPEAEALLIRALTWNLHGADVAAAEELGRMGRASSVLPLREAAARDTGRAFRIAVQNAIAEIQSRLAGASPGQLSLTANTAGQLSVVASDTGRLSVVATEGGQPAVADSDRPLSTDAEEPPPRS